MNEQEFAELAAGHALGALSADDEREFGVALAAHPEWAHIVEDDTATAAALAEAVADVSPPPRLRAELLARIGPGTDARDGSRHDGPVTGRGRRGARIWFALAASLVLIAAIGLGVSLAAQQALRPAAVVALEEIEASADAQTATTTVAGGGDATLHWSESLGKAVLVTKGLPAIGDDESFEMWFVRGDAATPAGVFGAAGTTIALLTPGLQPGDVIAVTVEPAGGSPDGQPSGDPILAIATA